MKLQEQIKQDLLKLVKVSGSGEKELLKVILAEISRESTKEVENEQVIKILKKMKENAITCGNIEEIPILDRYLPQMLSEVQIGNIVKYIIDNGGYTSMKDMGLVMRDLKSHEQSNLIDNKIASQICKNLLNK